MQAYEFYAKTENGVIKIPDEYKNRFSSEVKVIILEDKRWKIDKEEIRARRKSDLLLAPSMSTKGWKFDREEANER